MVSSVCLKNVGNVPVRLMFQDEAPSHKGKELEVPENIALVFLPSYSPELNPAEQLWNVLRRDYFANKVFDSLNVATCQAETGLAWHGIQQRGVEKAHKLAMD